MKNLLYTFRYLLKNKGNNLIKVISLTLGLVVGLILFSQVAFEMSFDNFYKDKDQLYAVYLRGSINKGDSYETRVVYGPYASTMMDEFEEVISATNKTFFPSERLYKIAENTFQEKTIYADSLFFTTLGFDMIMGNPLDLTTPEKIFVSESFANRVFKRIDIVGEKLHRDDDLLTVAGVFADLPKNGHLQFDVASSMGNRPLVSWRGGDSYNAYVKVAKGTNIRELESKFPDMMRRHYDVDDEIAQGVIKEIYLKPITVLHTGEKDVQRLLLILSILAFSLLLAAAMNYVLISISSLANRAKSVGVHKCNGASNMGIFKMFMNETAVLMVISLILAFLIILIFRSPVETLMKTDLTNIFSLQNSWVIFIVLAVLFFITGFIPARIFASIPVTQVFRNYADNKKTWKKTLLFTQFAGIGFMVTLLLIIFFQYHMILNREAGYQIDNLIVSENTWRMSQEQLQTVKEEFLRMPEVESVALTTDLPTRFISGYMIYDRETRQELFSTRLWAGEKDFFKTFHIPLIAGRNFNDNSASLREVIVNETFVRTARLENPIGEQVLFSQEPVTICGVMSDFVYQSFFRETPPMLYAPVGLDRFETAPLISIHLNVPLKSGLIDKFNETLRRVSNNEDAYFVSFKEDYEQHYYETKLFRNSVIVASLIMLFITLLGLIGFVQDEVNRRRKEIAIRKVNGAEILNILSLLIKDVSYIALPAIIIGLLISYYVGTEWLQQFVVKIPLSLTLFTLSCISILTVITLCVIARSWNVANENPVLSLKSE